VTRLLAIDTAGPVLGLAVLDQGRIQHAVDRNGPLQHVEHIVPQIGALLEEVGWPIASLEAVAVSAGPGSFTGLRVGMAAAKALSLAGGIPVISVDTLMALAATEQYHQEIISTPSAADRPSTIVPVMDARKQQFYAAAFRNNDALDRLSEDRDLPLEDVRRMVQAILSAEQPSWCVPGAMGSHFEGDPGYVPAVVQTASAAVGTARLGYRLMRRGTIADDSYADDSYQGPFYLRSGDIGVRSLVPRFASREDAN
jgi:tRNA threonylcarbamoyladenosine biosynthesis protein TsaB